MPALRKLYKDVRVRRGVLASLVLFLLLAGFSALSQRATDEAKALKSEIALQFEASPEDWLKNPREVSDFHKALTDGHLANVGVVTGGVGTTSGNGLLLYTLTTGEKLSAVVPGCWASSCSGVALDRLAEESARSGFTVSKVEVDWRTPSQKTLDALSALSAPLMLVVILCGALVLAVRLQLSMAGGTGKAALLAERPELTFNDVIGAQEAKAALERVTAFMRDPEHYVKVGARPPRGVLLVGPPGTGKTLLAKALAGQCKANFIAVDGSYFTSMFFGAGVSKVRELFALARKSAPCVLFIDEIDGIGKRITGGMHGSDSELNRIINRLLVEMDGFASMEHVVVVGATNHAENVDPAMRRPGRFDMQVNVTLPTLPERQQLFELYLNKVAHDGSADTRALARMTAGMSPADIANTVNKAASKAAEARRPAVTAEYLLGAIETFQMGGEVSSLKNTLTEALRVRIAYHEAGHALVAHLLGVGNVDRVTIEPRGQALGVTYVTRATEDPLYGNEELTSRLAMMLAGREAELLRFSNLSSGASDDLKKASELAVTMVGNLGFSETFGLLSVAGVPEKLLGPDIQAAVLVEARRMLETAQRRCASLLEEHRVRLEALAQLLLERECVSGEPLLAVLDGRSYAETPALLS
jgi:cell division protease FtsH